MDIHIKGSLPEDVDGKLEILEAGTGQGALTLYLARAIHPANLMLEARSPEGRGPSYEDMSSQEIIASNESRDQRRAIIHTVDISPTFAEHAKGIVKGFRQGMYQNDIDFHVGDVSEWIEQQIQNREVVQAEDPTFLSHIILDMPNADKHVAKAASALHVDGNLLVFNPSISQIMTVVDIVKREYLPLELDTVLELGQGITGGREWDVRSVVPRAQLQVQRERKTTMAEEGSESTDAASEDDDRGLEKKGSDGEVAGPMKQQNPPSHMVCRPKVGGMVKGGGFVGVWKKMKRKQ